MGSTHQLVVDASQFARLGSKEIFRTMLNYLSNIPLGHALHHSRYDVDTQGPYGSLEDSANAITDIRGNWVTGTHPGGVFERTILGYVSNGIPDMYHGEAEYPTSWDSNLEHEARNEDFADMYMNWVYDSFDYSSEAYIVDKGI